MKKIFLVLISLCMVLGYASCKRAASPSVTKAEFPFEIVYEIDGEVREVNDVFVCEFDGFGWNESAGENRRWKGYIKSSGERDLVLLEDGNLKFTVNLGSPAYYMGDPSMAGVGEYTPKIQYTQTLESGGVSSGVLDGQSWLSEYNIRLISWELSEPIENTFE